MPIHSSAFTSRHKLDHPDETDPPVIAPTTFERVMKYNPNHDAKGRFAAAAGGRHGTEGPPTEDAFGNPLKSQRNKAISQALAMMSPEARATMDVRRAKWKAQASMDSGFNRGGAFTPDPKFHKGSTTPHFDAHFNRGEKPIEAHTLRYPPEHSKGGQFSLPTSYTGSLKGGKPTKRSTFS